MGGKVSLATSAPMGTLWIWRTMSMMINCRVVQQTSVKTAAARQPRQRKSTASLVWTRQKLPEVGTAAPAKKAFIVGVARQRPSAVTTIQIIARRADGV